MIEIGPLAANQWHDIFALSGLDVGTPLVVYNKSASGLVVWESQSGPGEFFVGVPLGLDEPVAISDGSPGAWVRGMVPVTINVQEIA